ncbi:MAG: hypothetical protein LC107_05740 [Chitinophagales bacterium]|nr:hypothetical protein [Chitinophagales bacterium]
MRIYSITKTLAFPLIASAIIIFYVNYNTPFDDKGFIFIPVVLLVVLYVFNGPIDHWWMTKFPVKFDDKLDEWLTRFFKPYLEMDAETKTKFQHRMTLYIEGRLFQSVGSEMKDVPYDIKGMIAAHGVYMTLQQTDYLIGDTDRIYLYKHPFPTPEHQYLHNVEFNKEDGVIILSLEQMANAVLSPDQFYNIGYHAYAEAFLANTHVLMSVNTGADTWPALEVISGWSQADILGQIGLKDVALLPIHITLFFSFSDRYREVLPQQYEALYRIFHGNQAVA